MSRAVAAVGLLAALLLSACGKKAEPAPEPSPGPVAGEPKPAEPDAAEKEKADREEAKKRLRHVGKARHHFHVTNGDFPAGTITRGWNVGLSGRVQLLPHLGEEALCKHFKLDEPWDGPNNIKLLERIPPPYAPTKTKAPPGYTYLRGVKGERAAFRPGRPRALTERDFPDGLVNTIVVIEAGDAVP